MRDSERLHSKIQAEAIAEHIPYVIGISTHQGPGRDRIRGGGFLRCLGAGKPIEAAFQFARNAVSLCGHSPRVGAPGSNPEGVLIVGRNGCFEEVAWVLKYV